MYHYLYITVHMWCFVLYFYTFSYSSIYLIPNGCICYWYCVVLYVRYMYIVFHILALFIFEPFTLIYYYGVIIIQHLPLKQAVN